jgi:DNA mismatch repair protein MutL
MTFWFRWEAISAISSVSDMEIISKNINEDFWSKLEILWWIAQNIETYATETWTKIIVDNLFYNTPARLNYLKKARTEYNHILTFLQQISLSYPHIGFEFISEWKQIFKYIKWENLKTRIYNVYWSDFAENLLEINFLMDGINISWFISDPKVSFPNKNRQSLFVNKRVIKSPLIFKAINDAYNRFIPHSMYPWYVLNLEIDPTQVDVNVHPRKLEIRFASEQNIFRAVYHSIQEKLDRVSLIDTNSSELIQNIENKQNNFSSQANKNNFWYTWSWTKFKAYSPYTDKAPNINQTQINNAIHFSKIILNDNNKYLKENELENSTDLHNTALWKIIWQSHNSYIIVETNNWIKFLDQHALAERIIYEKLINNDYWHNVQWLLIWESISLTPKEIDILEINKTIFKDMWFDFEIMSWNIVIINGIPDFIKKENISNIFMWIIEDIWNHKFSKSTTLDEVKNKIFAYTACRSAIKFGHKLNLFEMNKLLNDSVIDYSATCPHWRPVIFEIHLDELKNKYER